MCQDVEVWGEGVFVQKSCFIVPPTSWLCIWVWSGAHQALHVHVSLMLVSEETAGTGSCLCPLLVQMELVAYRTAWSSQYTGGGGCLTGFQALAPWMSADVFIALSSRTTTGDKEALLEHDLSHPNADARNRLNRVMPQRFSLFVLGFFFVVLEIF